MKKFLLAIFLIGMIILPAAADRYYVHTQNPLVMAVFEKMHKFPDSFSTELVPAQINMLNKLSMEDIFSVEIKYSLYMLRPQIYGFAA